MVFISHFKKIDWLRLHVILQAWCYFPSAQIEM